MTATYPASIDTGALPQPGVWSIDASHSTVGFTVRHLMVSKVRGRFASLAGTVQVAEDVTDSSVEVSMQAASITTGDETRDEHLRSSDFLDAESHPELTFTASGIEQVHGELWRMRGELTIRGVTREVELTVSYLGLMTDPWGNDKAVFTAETELDREEFGLTWNAALEAGGVLVGTKIAIEIDLQLARVDG